MVIYSPSITGSLSISSSGAFNNVGSANFTGSVFVTGSVGIGTTNPAAKLVVSNAGLTGIEFDPSGSSIGGASISSYNRGASSRSDLEFAGREMQFYTGNPSLAIGIKITSGSNIGIGTTTPSSSLHIYGSTYFGSRLILERTAGAIGRYSLGVDTANNQFGITDEAQGNLTRFSINAAGNVGLGVSSPASKLEISGSGTANSIMTQPIIAAYASNGFNLGSDGTNSLIGVSNSGTDMVFLKRAGGVYSEAMRITSGGEVRIGSGGLKFSSGSTALNYYEEGTFSPTNTSQNFDAVTVISGRYVRIGNQVTINCRWNVDANTTGMKYLVFDLPFAFFNNANINFTGIVSNYNNGASSASSNVGTSVRNTAGSTTQQYIQAYYTSTGTGVTLLFSMTYQTF